MIFVNSNEQRSRVPELLKKLYVPTQICEFPVGDYIVGEIPVERKSIEDYCGSLSSGHLNEQLYLLSYNAELSYLLVEGLVSEALIYRKMKRDALISSLVGSSLKTAPDGKRGRVITVMLETAFDTALFLKHLHGKVVKGEPRLPRFVKKKLNPDETLRYIVSSFPKVGEVKADAMLKHFGSLRELMNASPEEIKQVSGIGDKIAYDIHSIVRREYQHIRTW